jgi:hypothetical protein
MFGCHVSTFLHPVDTALDDAGQPKIVLDVIAERIIEAARRGERDPVRLTKAALPWLTRE